MNIFHTMLLISTYFLKHSSSISLDVISSSLKALQFSPPFGVQSKTNLQIDFMRYQFAINKYIKREENYRICNTTLGNVKLLVLDAKNSALIVLDETPEKVFSEVNCEINQEVYFLIQENICETYTINHHKINRIIGKINENLEFEWIENKSFFQRRSNFQGRLFKVMVEEEGIWNMIDKNFKTEATFYSNNKTFDVTSYVSGITIDLINIMKSNLNFTTFHYLREDRLWGKMIQHANGTFEGIGVVGDIHFNRADIFGAMPSMYGIRAKFLDYIHPMSFNGKRN